MFTTEEIIENWSKELTNVDPNDTPCSVGKKLADMVPDEKRQELSMTYTYEPMVYYVMLNKEGFKLWTGPVGLNFEKISMVQG